MAFEESLYNEALALGVELTAARLSALRLCADTLAEWNAKLNLTAIKEPREVVTKLFADSLSLLPIMRKFQPEAPAKLLDVGTGAGFPGLVLWAVGAAGVTGVIGVTLLDSTRKRFAFIEAYVDALEKRGLADARRPTFVVERAEDAGRGILREAFPAVTARAVANTRILAELCLPFVEIGGFFYAMKGPGVHAELAEAGGRISELGGAVADVVKVELNGGIEHYIAVIKKEKQTPSRFPRRYDKIRDDRQPLLR